MSTDWTEWRSRTGVDLDEVPPGEPDMSDDTPGNGASHGDAFATMVKAAVTDISQTLGDSKRVERQPLFVPAGDLFTRDYPPTQWRVTGLLSDGGVAMLGAEPKSCKTWVATELAVAVATGTPVCGEFYAERGVVAYFYAEDMAQQVRNRLRALLAGRGLEPGALQDRLHVCPRGQFLDITRDEDLAWLVASCRCIGSIDLLILDPLRDISTAAEDKSDEMSQVMRRLRLLGELLGCTVAVAHHAAKASADGAKRRPGQRMRGSGAIHGATDSGIYIGVRGGDGVARFELEVDSEIKGARSAGRFGLELAVQDDGEGAAVKATWSVNRDLPASKANALAAADDAAMLDLVRRLAMRGEHRSKTALRDHDECPIPDRRARAALDRLLESGGLVFQGSELHFPTPTRSYTEES